jgi:hypothetical protein
MMSDIIGESKSKKNLLFKAQEVVNSMIKKYPGIYRDLVDFNGIDGLILKAIIIRDILSD